MLLRKDAIENVDYCVGVYGGEIIDLCVRNVDEVIKKAITDGTTYILYHNSGSTAVERAAILVANEWPDIHSVGSGGGCRGDVCAAAGSRFPMKSIKSGAHHFVLFNSV